MWMTSDGLHKVEVIDEERYMIYEWVESEGRWDWVAAVPHEPVCDPLTLLKELSEYVDLAELDEYPSVDMNK